MKPMKKMLILVSIFFLILFGIYVAKKLLFARAMSHYQPPPVTISTAEVKAANWRPYINSVGTLYAVNGVELAAETAGIVRDIQFKSGQFVKAGDLLAILDSSTEQAQLKSFQAKLKLTEMDYQRQIALFKKQAVSQAMIDSMRAKLQDAQANVEGLVARIRQKTITAPFAGKLGMRQINLGQYIAPGNTIASLQALNPLHVRFYLPEQYLASLSLNQPVTVTVDVGDGLDIEGKITAIDAKVKQSTRTIEVQATIANDKLLFYPGLFAYIKIWLPNMQQQLVVPQTAITYSLGGNFVYVIHKELTDLRARQQYIKLGEARGNEIAIIEGLEKGQQIVSAGQMKLQNGARVVINNEVDI
jgi:membrane fusion protein, multidrug efflux system